MRQYYAIQMYYSYCSIILKFQYHAVFAIHFYINHGCYGNCFYGNGLDENTWFLPLLDWTSFLVMCNKSRGQMKNTIVQRLTSHFFSGKHKHRRWWSRPWFFLDWSQGISYGIVSINILEFIILPPHTQSTPALTPHHQQQNYWTKPICLDPHYLYPC